MRGKSDRKACILELFSEKGSFGLHVYHSVKSELL